ncbi:phosphatase PAP2 family protein [Candidatus Kapabacteria bacterium]|nr:phosphatase PAP2 family protein [Candidatus Kapabacteria bacterium]
MNYLFRKKEANNLLRYIFLIVPIYIIYNNIKPLIKKLHSTDLDSVLINIDKSIFGLNPTEYLATISNPFLTEYLQIAYLLFYVLPILQALEYLMRESKFEFQYLLRNMIFGFLFSFILYLFIPAIGPRFTLHEYSMINNELPGLFFTEYIRNMVDYGGGILNFNLNPSIQVNRDCFPSGHTMMTIINIFVAFKYNSKLKYLILFIGISLIISTVYLRYHYVIDLIAGVLFGYLSIKIENLINRKIQLK